MWVFSKLFVAVIVLSHCLSEFVHGYMHAQRNIVPRAYTSVIMRRSAMAMVAQPANLPVTIPAKLSEMVSKF